MGFSNTEVLAIAITPKEDMVRVGKLIRSATPFLKAAQLARQLASYLLSYCVGCVAEQADREMSGSVEAKYRPDSEEVKIRTPSPEPEPPKPPKDPRSRFKYNPLFRIFFL